MCSSGNEVENHENLVSIIVPVRNQQDYLTKLISSLERSTYTSIEVIIVDDCSDPPIKIPETILPTTILSNHKNNGKAYSVNRGAIIAKGRILIITDPDIIFEPNLVSLWASALKRDSALGIVGAYVYFVSDPERITHAGAVMIGKFKLIPRRFVNVIDNGVSINCFSAHNLFLDDVYAVRREAWDSVGGMDWLNFDTMYEDVDLQFRIQSEGFTTAVIGGAKAYHFQSPNVGVPLSQDRADKLSSEYSVRRLVKNRIIFLRKHELLGKKLLLIHILGLLAFYGTMILISRYSLKEKVRRWIDIVRAALEGVEKTLYQFHGKVGGYSASL